MTRFTHFSADADRPAAARTMVTAALARIAAAGRRWYRMRVAIRHLHALDDRLLRDIGISRSEIDCFVGSRRVDRRNRD